MKNFMMVRVESMACEGEEGSPTTEMTTTYSGGHELPIGPDMLLFIDSTMDRKLSIRRLKEIAEHLEDGYIAELEARLCHCRPSGPDPAACTGPWE